MSPTGVLPPHPLTPSLTPAGDLTRSIIACGVDTLDTSGPTDPSSPHIISYNVADLAGNWARTVFRCGALKNSNS